MSASALTGFSADPVELPEPPMAVSDEVRERMASVIAAAICFKTPEEITGYLRDGFPAEVRETLEREHELDEIHAHIDVLLCVWLGDLPPSQATARTSAPAVDA